MSAPLQFVHRFKPAQRLDAQPLLLLHGTGGNEDDLLPIGQIISPGASFLSWPAV
jgi:phospholipase/carboxylesterase